MLADILAAAKARGLMGIQLLQHGSEYLALCVRHDGSPSDPRNWDHQPTPEKALADLATRLGVMTLPPIPKQEPAPSL